nr:MAG TPA: hypothetical protein [Caudoviricetes sp.]
MLGVGGVGLFCGRGHLQTRGNQGEIKGNKGNQGKPKGNPFNQQKKYLPINGSIFNQ